MEWQRLYSPCRPNNSRKDDIVQREHKLIVWLLNDGQGPVAEIARKRGIPRNRPYTINGRKKLPYTAARFLAWWASRTGCRTGAPRARST